jgi:putative Holliday junction resolvase
MLELSLPSAVEYLPLVDSLCQAFCVWTGMSQDSADDIAIAVVEAATNAVVHGNKCNRGKKVRLSFKPLPSEIVIQVADEGGGFNPGGVASPVDKANLLKESGRGIYIMKQIMDKVEFDFPDGGGTRVRMTKSLVSKAGRILCVDYGERRFGLALSDELRIIAQPLGMIDINVKRDPIAEIAAIAAANEAGTILVGMPFTLKGELARSASKVTAFARELNQRSGLPVVTWDERLSTKQGEQALIESGMRREKRKRKIDSVAAALILQSYLDAQKGT